jgi:serine O-acetyltransferase
MILAIEYKAILDLVCHQVNNMFTLLPEERDEIVQSFDETLKVVEYNFNYSANKYYSRIIEKKKEVYFNPCHSVQWMIFLYNLSHIIYVKGTKTMICDKIYYLNKLLNGVDLFYAIELPSLWGAEHPLGSIMGRAHYSNQFYFFQGCTVGGTGELGNEVYPVIGENVCMYSHSSILGNCHIGKNVKVGAGTLIKDQDVPDNSLVFGQSPNLIIKENKHKESDNFNI